MSGEPLPSSSEFAGQIASEALLDTQSQPAPTSADPPQNGLSEKLDGVGVWKERLVLISELCLVILVAFGQSIFTSVFPLFIDSNDFHTLRSYSRLADLLQVAAGVALLGYVLCPIGNSSHNQNSPAADEGKVTTLPPSPARKLISLLRVKFIGFLLVALISFGPSVFHWLFSWLAYVGYSAGLSRNLHHLNTMLWYATSLCVLAYVLRRRGRSFSDIGLSWDTGAVALTLPLIIVGILIASSEGPIIYWLGETFGHPNWRPPEISRLLFGTQVQIAAVPDLLLNGFFEELIVRAYLMTVVTMVTGKIWPAVLVSVAVQTSYHFYQSVPLALSHIPLFTVYSVFYAKTRSALPVALAHALTDLFILWHYGLNTALP